MAVIARSDDVRKGNRKRVLQSVRRGGYLSRTDIGLETGLSAATVSAVVADLLDAAALAVRPQSKTRPPAGRGRPKVSLSVNPQAATVGSITLQYNRLGAALFGYAGDLLAERSETVDTRDADCADLRSRLVSILKGVLDDSGQSAFGLRRIAVGVQGTTDADERTLMWSPAVSQRNLPIQAWLYDAFGVPVRVSNDCEMMARSLTGRDPDLFGDNFITVLLSHGVGMALWRNSRLVKGTFSSGMELGHMTYLPDGALCRCGRFGCIEAYAGDYAILRRARKWPCSAKPTKVVARAELEAIVQNARNNDGDALQALEMAGLALGTGLANLFALIDPVPVALVGNVTVAREFLDDPIRQVLHGGIQDESAEAIPIRYFEDENLILQEGCAVSALTDLDNEIANTLPQLTRADA